MKILRLVVLSALISIIALLLGDQIIYKYWFIPGTISMYHIPFYYHLFVLLPIFIMIIIYGLLLSSWKRVIVSGFVFGIIHQCYDFFTTVSYRSGDIIRYATENPLDFWIVRSIILIAIYIAALSLVRYSVLFSRKTISRLKLRFVTADGITGKQIQANSKKPEHSKKIKIKEDSMSTRITYHVLPDSTGWLVKRGKAKKASSTHKTKKKALRAASDLAKSHPLSQVVIHKASGIIETDRTFEHRHYKQKRKKREVIRKIKKGLIRSKRKEYLTRLRRRKAAKLGISRIKRKRYLRRLAARKGAKKRRRQ